MVSIDAGKAFEKSQQPFMIKVLNKPKKVLKSYLNTIKDMYWQHTANIMLNGERMKAFPLRSDIGQGYLLVLLKTYSWKS